VGASPLFPPQYQEQEAAKEAILQVVHCDPRQFGIEQSRWTLEKVRQVCDWLDSRDRRLEAEHSITLGGLSQLLDRLGLSWQRGRLHLHSPDPDYLAKLERIAELRQRVQASNGRLVLVYLDEFSYYRQPTIAQAWAEKGQQPRATLSFRSNKTPTRVVGALDLLTGRVQHRQNRVIGIVELVEFYRDLRQAYPTAEEIYAIQDNWPVHFHPDVLVALQEQNEQERQWPEHRPSNWPTSPSAEAVRKWGDLKLPIQLVRLPTYAPWTNPIEKLWRKLKRSCTYID
jgi:hypothetical protein